MSNLAIQLALGITHLHLPRLELQAGGCELPDVGSGNHAEVLWKSAEHPGHLTSPKPKYFVGKKKRERLSKTRTEYTE